MRLKIVSSIIFSGLFNLFSVAHAETEILDKKAAAALIQKQSSGKVLGVEQESQEDRTLFKVKVLHSDGVIKVYQIDSNGNLIE